MAFAESNRVSLRYIAETSVGVTPVAATFKPIRYTSESLTAGLQTQVSNEIRSDRQISDLIKTGTQIGGGFNFEMSYGSFDEFLAAAFCDTWLASVINVSTAKSSFSIEKYFSDINKAVVLQGMFVTGFTLNVEKGPVTGSFTFIGTGMSTPVSTITSAVSTARTDVVMNANAHITSVMVNGSIPAGMYFKSITFQLNNNAAAREAIGYAAPIDVRFGQAAVTGRISVYLNDLSLYSNQLAATPMTLSFTLIDSGSKGYQFYVPNLKFVGGNPQAGGANQDVMLESDYQALASTGVNTARVTRYGA